MPLSSSTCTSNEKYFFRFLTIITRKGSLMPSVFFGSAGHVTNVVATFVPKICIAKSQVISYLQELVKRCVLDTRIVLHRAYFEHQRLYVVVRNTFDVAIPNLREEKYAIKLFCVGHPFSVYVCFVTFLANALSYLLVPNL